MSSSGASKGEHSGGGGLGHSPYEKMPHDARNWTVPPAWNKKPKVSYGGSGGGKAKANAGKELDWPAISKAVNAAWTPAAASARKSGGAAPGSAAAAPSPWDGLWCATEKVHGANLCLAYDAATGHVRAGKRTSFLAPDDTFFGYQRVVSRYTAGVRAIAAQLTAEFAAAPDAAARGPLAAVFVYGELFGGGYPLSTAAAAATGGGKGTTKVAPKTPPKGTAVAVDAKGKPKPGKAADAKTAATAAAAAATAAAADATATADADGKAKAAADEPEPELVQREIWYCPHNEFYAFDIAVQFAAPTAAAPATADAKTAAADAAGDDDGAAPTAAAAAVGRKQYLDMARALDLFEAHGLFYAKPIVIGSLSDCINFDVEAFRTTVPARLGLPGLADGWAEGVVVKPLAELAVATGGKGGTVRAVFKRKSTRFDERMRASGQTANAGSKAAQCVALLTEFVTPNRLTNLYSKTGGSRAQFAAAGGSGGKGKGGGAGKAGSDGASSALVDAFVADVMTDAADDAAVHGAWTALDGSEQKFVSGELRKAVQALFASAGASVGGSGAGGGGGGGGGGKKKK